MTDGRTSLEPLMHPPTHPLIHTLSLTHRHSHSLPPCALSLNITPLSVPGWTFWRPWITRWAVWNCPSHAGDPPSVNTHYMNPQPSPITNIIYPTPQPPILYTLTPHSLTHIYTLTPRPYLPSHAVDMTPATATTTSSTSTSMTMTMTMM